MCGMTFAMACAGVAAGIIFSASVCTLVLFRGDLQFASSSVSRLLQDEDGESVMVSFVGAENNERNDWSQIDGVALATHVLRRPSWQKTARCADDSSESCEECWSSSDCWSSDSNSRVVHSEYGFWKRFISSVHVRCPSNKIDVHYEVRSVRNGQLRFLWDGLEVGNENSFIDFSNDFQQRVDLGMQRLSGEIHILVDGIGGHVFQVEFISFGEDSRAELTALEIAMPQMFVHCEDFKVCLDPLGAGDEALQMLRNNNHMQLACLESTSSEGACALWRGCLPPEKQQSLLSLLRAAVLEEIQSEHSLSAPSSGPSIDAQDVHRVDTASEIFSSPFEPSSDLSSADALCVDPALEDVESWNCDCYQEMQQSCAEVDGREHICLRALICEHESVCDTWKQAAGCDTDAEILAVRDDMHRDRRLLEAMMDRKSGSRALLARRQVDSLDRALGGKSCQ